jgi:signal transduction histidine kinase
MTTCAPSYEALLAAFPEHLFRLDAQGRMVTLKPADDARTPEPPTTWAPRDVDAVLSADAAALLRHHAAEVLATGAERVTEFEDGATGRDVRFEARLLPDGADAIIVIVRDLSTTLAQDEAQKLEALGRLSAGVAHEINTPIQFVAHNAEFMSTAFAEMRELLICYRRALSSDQPLSWEARNTMLAEAESMHDVDFLLEEVPKAVDETLEGVRRVAVIVRALKVFSHPTAAKVAPSDINECVRNAVIVSASEHKTIADIDMELDDVPLIPCVVGEMMQVFLNLIVNAAHALQDAGCGDEQRGTITLRSRPDGDDVVITVSDDGPGISHADQQRIFEPFFTTKEVGRGTGQGLALSRAMVDKHGGALSVHSSPGAGATFTVRLPIHDAQEDGGSIPQHPTEGRIAS